MFSGIGLIMDGDMMPGAWLALDNRGAVIGSGVIGIGEQWNGDKKMVRDFKVSPEVYGALLRHTSKTQPNS